MSTNLNNFKPTYISDDEDFNQNSDYSDDSESEYLNPTKTPQNQEHHQKLQKLNKMDDSLTDQMNNKVKTDLLNQLQKQDTDFSSILKDKNDRATVDQVLDPRTLIIIHKLIQNNKISKLYGCISTGKEANVYLTEGRCKDFSSLEMIDEHDENLEFAVKIFKTSILIFKDRERYVNGEFRFRKGHCKGNPRKKVKLWAEKEVRNLKRICMSGKIRAPWPYYLKNNVIVMEFVGTNGVAAPRLKDAVIGLTEDGKKDETEISDVYFECIMMMRHLYQECKLIHGDLSEYNLLYHNKQVWMIDVSQSVEQDHPMALDFLRRDCSVMNDFFRKNKVFVLTTLKLFNFVTNNNLTRQSDEEVEKVLNQLLLEAQNGYSDQEYQEDKVFEQIYIPRSLQEISHEEIMKQNKKALKEIDENQNEIMNQNSEHLLIFQNLNLDNKADEEQQLDNEKYIESIVKTGQIQQSDDQQDDDESSEQNSEEENSDNDSEIKSKKVGLTLVGMTKEEKKAHKQRVKEENREKRKNKLSKYDKKKAINKGKK